MSFNKNPAYGAFFGFNGHNVTSLSLEKEKKNAFPGLSLTYDHKQSNKTVAGRILCTYMPGLKGSQQRPKKNINVASLFHRILISHRHLELRRKCSV